MSLKDLGITIVQRATGAHLFRVLPRGLDLLHDMKNNLPRLRVDVVFDVGANVGQSAARFLPWFPDARLYCFEPVPATFDALRQRLAGESRVRCLQLAFGAVEGTAAIVAGDDSSMSFVRRESEGSTGADEPGGRVQVTTVDAFCTAHRIDRVGYLKVDTEGADLDVLAGAAELLAGRRIDVLEVEAGMHPGNERHVPCEAFKAYLEPRSYLLFGVYEQVAEWPTKRPHLRRANLAFVSRDVVEANRQ